MFFEEDNDDVCVGSSLRKKKVQKIKFVSSLFLVVFTLRGCTFLYSYPLLGAVGTKGISANLWSPYWCKSLYILHVRFVNINLITSNLCRQASTENEVSLKWWYNLFDILNQLEYSNFQRHRFWFHDKQWVVLFSYKYLAKPHIHL